MGNAPAECYNLGSIDKVPLGQGLCYKVGGREIAVFRQRNGKVFATQNRCPHKQGALAEGIIGDGKVICPLHSHKFELDTGHGSEKDECLTVYPIRVEDGQIHIEVAAIV
jgi:nitrite reductase (NADH) small subunit